MTPALQKSLTVPPLAWPTVMLAGAALAVWGVGIGLVEAGAFWSGLVVMALGAYVSFTPLHDATHRAVASKHPWLNDAVGRLAVVPLFGPYLAFRFVHLEHHAHTNEADADPDQWSARGPAALLPLRWVTQDLYYYAVYLRAGRPPAEVADVVISLALLVGGVALLVATGHGALALAWLVSSRLALGALAFAFDWLPHRPHTVLQREDRFRATTMRLGLGWQVLLVNQSHHLVHHLQPQVPFYKYPDLWKAQEGELRARGAVVVNEPPGAPAHALRS
ncbi:MAG: fatty acid desaturase [Myxococcaceae bacterium]|jgi:beta-carotene hydroxylase|nr:fatty acid desaturase [Myxococcaceae bacterium]